MGDSEPATWNVADRLYPIGKILTLNARLDGTSNHQQKTIQVKVKHQQRRWTLSCRMVVEPIPSLSEEPEGTQFFLKLFDRRGAQQLREENGLGPWTQAIDDVLFEDLQSGAVGKFLRNLHHVPDFLENTEADWNAAENEAYLTTETRKIFHTELSTYKHLKGCQGICIPRLFAIVSLDKTIAKEPMNKRHRSFFQPTGLLLEYLPGFTLSDMIDNAPRSSWQDIIDRAIEIVHIISDHNVLNDDVRADNFMVVPNNGSYNVFMIDFGMCRVRRPGESDAVWGLKKWLANEERSLGTAMQKMLSKVGFELRYKFSERYHEWAEKE